MLRKIGANVFLFLIIFFLVINSSSAQGRSPQSSHMAGKKLAFVIAYNGYEDTEFKIPKKILEAKGAAVTVASSEIGTAKGMYQHDTTTDILLEKLDVTRFDAIIFIGGVGVRSAYWENANAHRIAKEAVKTDKIIGAICWAPVILANAGILEGKQATGNSYGNAHDILKSRGANYTGETVTVDGNIITAFGPEAAEDFAKAILSALK